MDLDATSDNAKGQKGLSPEGFARNALASSAGHSWQNSNIHSFLTGC
jgi:hypothetical protein